MWKVWGTSDQEDAGVGGGGSVLNGLKFVIR